MGIVTAIKNTESVTRDSVTDSDVVDFSHIRVTFDVTDADGFLVSSTQEFSTLRLAMEFVRRLNRRAELS